MANLTITQLPTAQTLTGQESVPVVQNGVTVQTTTGAIANSPVLTQTFLTVGSQPALGNSRSLTVGPGLGTVDNGAGSTYSINLTDAPLSLVTSGNGFQVKTNANTLVNRSITVGSGLGVTNGDGVAGDPQIAYSGVMSNLAALSGTGLVAINGTSATQVSIIGVANQTTVLNGNGIGSPTIGFADNPAFPGSAAITIPAGGTAQRPVGVVGEIRYNLDLGAYEAFQAGLWRQFSLAGGVTQVNTGTGLTGGPITGVGTVSLADTAVTPGTYGSATQVGQFQVDAQGRLIAAANIGITPSGIGAVASVTGTANEITVTGTTNVTLSLPTALTFTGKTVTNGSFVTPVIKNNFKFEAAGIAAYTQFPGTIGSWISNTNNFQVVYAENQNSGSDASADWVAYNDASDGASYFIDMGINSSGFTSVLYPIFTPNSAYIFTGGGTSGQQTDFYLGTSNAASDIIFFTGDVQLTNIRGAIHGDTGNWTIGVSLTDTGEQFQVAGSAKITGAAAFGGTVLLSANPTLALQAATKQYVDSAVSTGFTVHPSVNLATTAALPTNTYSNGASGVGATLTAVATGVLTIDGVTATAGMRVLIKNEAAAANNGVYSVTTAGAVGVAYVLTRVTDFDQAAAGEIANNAYFFVTAGSTLISTSFVLSQTATIVVGTTALPFTLFASALTYTGGTNINVAGQVISLTGTVAATNGGTGTSTVAVGDLLYGSATNTWSKLSLGSAYKSLLVNAAGNQIEWNSIPLNQPTAVSGQLGVSNGGTGASTLTGYVTGNGTSAFTASATIPSTAITGLGTISTQNANAVAITGGAINGATIGATTATTGAFTTLSASGVFTSTVATGTAPFTVASTTAVGNLTATNAVNTGATATSTGATNYLVFKTATSGNLPDLVNSSITANAGNGTITGGIAGGAF
ncbi:hypothetical protein UFOVP56_15 [uncultured Caudovirales phage]|uniref:Uncharacterized protein n=1 Tax=uncultured Caudovirales phage TaxID=2100421 RepID=A0A6J5TAC3_9CAUD|nr:hypothetical protein UFOVP56_15 [uncultured Caudovirales phage]